MKKLLCMLTALLLVLLLIPCDPALAEAPEDDEAPDITGYWNCGITEMDIMPMPDDHFDVTIYHTDDRVAYEVWNYFCAYDSGDNMLHSTEPGVKSVLTADENANIDVSDPVYTDGSATFSIDDDYILTWHDDKEDAGAGMQFEQSLRHSRGIDVLCADGGFVIQVGVEDGDDGWQAVDDDDGEAVVKLVEADTLDDTFVVRFEPAGDGDATVGAKHVTGDACDEYMTWNVHVQNEKIQSITAGSFIVSPEEYSMDTDILGEWQINDEVMAGMTVAIDEDHGWDIEIRMASPEVRVIRANIVYDCALTKFVYSGGTVYAAEITDDPDPALGDALATDASGSLELIPDGKGGLDMLWCDGQNPDLTARFHRPEGWGEKTIQPMFDGLDLNDGEYAASFDRANLADGVLADVHIFSDDCYDIVDIARMAPGDVLEIGGKTVMICTLDEDAYGDKLINGGFDWGGITLCAYDEDNCWMSLEDDDYHSLTERAVETLALDANVAFTDGWDPDAEPIAAKGIDDVTQAIQDSENEDFNELNTKIRMEGGKVVAIDRHFIP